VGPVDAEVVEQADRLGDVLVPGEPLEAAAGPAGLAAVEDDAGVALGERVDEAEVRVAAEGRPVLQARVEPAGAEHEHGRPLADGLVPGGESVEVDDGHGCS